MAVNLPTTFIDEVRLAIIDETSYTDNQVRSFAKLAILNSKLSLPASTTIVDGTSIWDYTISGGSITSDMSTELWEVYKWATVVLILERKLKDYISDGVGISFGLGAESIDTKTILITVRDLVRDAQKTLTEKLKYYNLLAVPGVEIDLYRRECVW
jgi:hypothetical protein